MAGYDDDIIHAPCNSIIPILIAFAAIACEIHAGEGREIRFAESLMVSVNRAGHRWPGKFYGEPSFHTLARQLISFFIHDGGLHTRQWERGIAWLRFRYVRDG